VYDRQIAARATFPTAARAKTVGRDASGGMRCPRGGSFSLRNETLRNARLGLVTN